jgi:protein-S-isoprenylcysteine O-methyltransferase Ste14
MDLDSLFHSYIGRIVAFILAPLLALAVPPLVELVNDVLGTDFSDQQITYIAIATVVGVALVLWQWLRNRGDWEKSVLEVEKIFEVGREHVEQPTEPVTPPGVTDA